MPEELPKRSTPATLLQNVQSQGREEKRMRVTYTADTPHQNVTVNTASDQPAPADADVDVDHDVDENIQLSTLKSKLLTHEPQLFSKDSRISRNLHQRIRALATKLDQVAIARPDQPLCLQSEIWVPFDTVVHATAGRRVIVFADCLDDSDPRLSLSANTYGVISSIDADGDLECAFSNTAVTSYFFKERLDVLRCVATMQSIVEECDKLESEFKCWLQKTTETKVTYTDRRYCGEKADHMRMADVHLTIMLMSGETLCEIVVQRWADEPSWSIARVKESIRSHLGSDQAINALLHNAQVLKDDDTLPLLGIESEQKAVLQAVICGIPRLHLFEPCSARELSERRGCSAGRWNMYGSHIVADGVEHYGMDTAPTAAQEVAKDMQNAAPDLDDTRINGGDSDENGEIVVIANAGDDPKLACFKALGFLASDPDEDVDLFQLTTLDERSWHEYFNRGFNVEDDEDLDEDDDDLDEDEDKDDGLLAITKIMAERLSGHFEFSFTGGVVCAPVIYGGYTADGSIVGVISARVWT